MGHYVVCVHAAATVPVDNLLTSSRIEQVLHVRKQQLSSKFELNCHFCQLSLKFEFELCLVSKPALEDYKRAVSIGSGGQSCSSFS